MSPGDLVGWNWSGDTNITNLNHVTIYLGNNLLASHSSSALDVSVNSWYQNSLPNYVRHLVHILDAPELAASVSETNQILSWGTNWTGYALYSATNLSTDAAWTKVAKSPVVVGRLNVMTNAMSSDAAFYRLMLP